MANCDWTSPESYPGKGDGGISCAKPAMADCCVCNQDYCNQHFVFCEDCNSWMCAACAGDHVCKKLPRPTGPDVIEELLGTAQKICG
jgi:hypothetical protein